ncbi:MAG: FAD-binding protein [Actinomycetota bacterium]|nr:FAD-binding protein [Actinomycetota bacterium]
MTVPTENYLRRAITDLAGLDVSVDEGTAFADAGLAGDAAWAVAPRLQRYVRPLRPILRVRPTTEDDVVRAATVASAHGLAILPHGAGEAPLSRVPALAVDLRGYTGMVASGPGWCRARAGTVLFDLDELLRGFGEELRVFDSRKRLATVGAFTANGGAGVGSLRHGAMTEPGNIDAVRLVTSGAAPRAVELAGDDPMLRHLLRTGAVITEVEMPSALAWAWREMVVSFPDLDAAARFALAIGEAEGLEVKDVSPVCAQVAGQLTPLSLPGGLAAALCTVAPHSRSGLLAAAYRHGGRLLVDTAAGSGPDGIPLYEYTWGGSMRWVKNRFPCLTTVKITLPRTDPMRYLARLTENLPGPRWAALNHLRADGVQRLQLLLGVDGENPGALSAVSDRALELGCLPS